MGADGHHLILFAQVEGEIDKICVSKDGKHEWERSGMIFFEKLCQNDESLNVGFGWDDDELFHAMMRELDDEDWMSESEESMKTDSNLLDPTDALPESNLGLDPLQPNTDSPNYVLPDIEWLKPDMESYFQHDYSSCLENGAGRLRFNLTTHRPCTNIPVSNMLPEAVL